MALLAAVSSTRLFDLHGTILYQDIININMITNSVYYYAVHDNGKQM